MVAAVCNPFRPIHSNVVIAKVGPGLDLSKAWDVQYSKWQIDAIREFEAKYSHPKCTVEFNDHGDARLGLGNGQWHIILNAVIPWKNSAHYMPE